MHITGLKTKTIIFKVGVDLENLRVIENGQESYNMCLAFNEIRKQTYDIGYYEGAVACVKALMHSLGHSMNEAMDYLKFKEIDKPIITAMCTKKYIIDFNPVAALKEIGDEAREHGYRAAVKFHAKTIISSKKLTEEIALDILEVTGENKKLLLEQIKIENGGLEERCISDSDPVEEAFAKGVEQGVLITLYDLYKSNMITLEGAAQKAIMTVTDFLTVADKIMKEHEQKQKNNESNRMKPSKIMENEI